MGVNFNRFSMNSPRWKNQPAIFISFVFAQLFMKFYKNCGTRKLQDWPLKQLKNYFCRSNIERARRSQSSITFFLIHLVQLRSFLIDYLQVITLKLHHHLLQTLRNRGQASFKQGFKRFMICFYGYLPSINIIVKLFAREDHGQHLLLNLCILLLRC